MMQDLDTYNKIDDNGMPAGGFANGTGIDIRWQNGPLGRDDDRTVPNGAFVEGVIQAAKQRLEWYQSTQFACDENADAIECLGNALAALESRTKRREKAGIEGTHGLDSDG